MHNIVFKDRTYQCREDETLLQAFLRQGAELNFSCQKGSCQVCMLHCVDGELPGLSQSGLKPLYAMNDYFLPCQCHPVGDMKVAEIEHNKIYKTGFIHKKEFLSESVCKLLIDCDQLETYSAGQYLNLCRVSDGVARSYSIASYPDQEYFIEVHVRRMKNGELSNWIFDELEEGDAIDVQGPIGNCCYNNCDPKIPLLMIASGTGLAPIVGVLKEALGKGHKTDIHLYHEARSFPDLYYHGVLSTLAAEHENLSYFPCVPGAFSAKEVFPGAAIERIKSDYPDLRYWRIYTAGSSEFVFAIYELAIAMGANDSQVYGDVFDLQDLRKHPRSPAMNNQLNVSTENSKSKSHHSETRYPEPDPELWEALDQGKKLNSILKDFYDIVYDDPYLSPYFHNTTKQRSVEKVSLFMRQLLSGEKVYIGDRPRNAHHWMVISDEIFDYRESIMESCLRKHGLPEHLLQRWLAIEELFRPDIVKQKPWNKVVNGIELPVDGYDEIVLECGSLCDSCQSEIDAGTTVRYHLRLGKIYCPDCMSSE